MSEIQIKDILDFIGTSGCDYTFSGNERDTVCGFSSIKNYISGTVTWLKEDKSVEDCTVLRNIKLLIYQKGLQHRALNAIETSQSKKVFFSLVEHFFDKKSIPQPIGRGTYLSPDVKISKNVIIGSNCILDGDISIGEGTRIWNNVTIINKVQIGKNCDIQSGVVIGHDGYGYTLNEQNEKSMIKHFGGVWIGDSVLIGPNSVVDRGTIDQTVIGNGVKIDALCFIAHNVTIGDHCSLIVGTKFYGSSIAERNAYIATGIVRNQCVVGENAIVGMGAVVTKNVSKNVTVVGNPAKELLKNK